MEPYKLDLTCDECKEILDTFVAKDIQPYQPIHLYPDFVTPHKKEGFRRRIEAILSAVNPEDKHILDLGCAVGYNLYEFVQKGATGVGVDISENNIHTASCLAKLYGVEDKVKFYCGDVYEYVMETEEHFDIVLNLNLLNHIINQVGTDKGWNMMKVLSTKCNLMITNYYQGVEQEPKNILYHTTYNNCDVIMIGDSYYCNMGRPLYKAWKN